MEMTFWSCLGLALQMQEPGYVQGLLSERVLHDLLPQGPDMIP